MVDIEQKKPNHWLIRWLVPNVLAEIPIAGSFFEKETWSESVHAAGKCTSMLVGGSIGMMYPIDTTNNERLDMTAGMAIGMMTGKVTFNVLCSVGKTMLPQYFATNQRSQDFEANNSEQQSQSLTRSLTPNMA
jgi:hypothetical protein